MEEAGGGMKMDAPACPLTRPALLTHVHVSSQWGREQDSTLSLSDLRCHSSPGLLHTDSWWQGASHCWNQQHPYSCPYAISGQTYLLVPLLDRDIFPFLS
jgi:hypothetical protein